jgi:hypothetical protein
MLFVFLSKFKFQFYLKPYILYVRVFRIKDPVSCIKLDEVY